MKSGDFSNPRNDEATIKAFADIRDRHFEQRTFSTRPALVAKQLLNGHRMTKDYHGEPYDTAAFDLVEGMWDHEHCSVCWFKIKDGYTYWENHKRVILLCDACYEAFTKA